MSITRQVPNKIRLSGGGQEINDCVASAAITPGYLIERHSSSGLKFRAHATAGGLTPPIFALDMPYLNKTIDDAYASGDLVEALIAERGSVVYALIGSGQNIAVAGYLESNGDGTLRAFGSGTKIAQALEAVNNSAGLTAARIRAEVQ